MLRDLELKQALLIYLGYGSEDLKKGRKNPPISRGNLNVLKVGDLCEFIQCDLYRHIQFLENKVSMKFCP